MVLFLLEDDVVVKSCATLSRGDYLHSTLDQFNESPQESWPVVAVSERTSLHFAIRLRTPRIVPRCNMGVVIRKICNALRSTQHLPSGR